ncbi:MAG: glucoamylase family protein [Opitutaceae bacterium]
MQKVSFGLAVLFASAVAALSIPRTIFAAPEFHPTPADLRLLDGIEQGALRYFIEHSDPHTGLAQDRAPANGSPGDAAASISATGFALTAFCIGAHRGWLQPGEAKARIERTLRFAADEMPNQHGWFYHFVDPRTGRRAYDSEISTIDTALFLQGAVFAREYLRDPAADAYVRRIYRRIDWRWALNGGLTLSHGWLPETGFIPYRWDSYSELMGMYLLGLGAPSRPLPAECWRAWKRRPLERFDGQTFIQCGPLFTHQYAQAWFYFRGRHDAFADYWQNSVDATLDQRAWSAAQHARFHHWSKNLWGLTASDGEHGYMAWGTPGPEPDESDGTLVPCAPAGSLPFAPRDCLTSLHDMLKTGGPGVWGRYGFVDSFNPETGWVDPDVIGIDQGISMIMAENLRSGLVWRTFMEAPEVRRAMKIAGFVPERPRNGPVLAVLMR